MAEPPEAEPVGGLDLVDDYLEAVAQVERHCPRGEGLQDDRHAAGAGSLDPVLEQRRPQAPTLVVRVDGQQAEVPVSFGGNPADGGRDRIENGAETL